MKKFHPKTVLDLIYIILIIACIMGSFFLGIYFYSIRFYPNISATQIIILVSSLFLIVTMLLGIMIGLMFLSTYFLRKSPLYSEISEKMKPLSRAGKWLFYESSIYYFTLMLFLYFYPSNDNLNIGIGLMLFYFLGCNFICLKKLDIFDWKKYVELSFSFFFISLLVFFTTVLVVSFMDSKKNELLCFFPIVQLLILICVLSMSTEREAFGKNVVMTISIFLMGTFILGVFGNITHNLTLHLNIRKEHVNITLDKESCTAAASLLGCNEPIIPKGGYCSLPNVTVPVALGTLHRVNIPIRKFSDLIQCEISTEAQITNNMILAYDIDEAHIHYGQVIAEIKNKSS